MKRLCIGATVGSFPRSFMKKDIALLSKFFLITIISSDIDEYRDDFEEYATLVRIPIVRKINILKDIKSLILLFSFLKKNKFDIALSVTPKMGFLMMIAAYIVKVPHRVHYFTGQVWFNKTGLKFKLLKTLDKIIALLSTFTLVCGQAQQDFLIQQKIIAKINSKVLFHGVDLTLFKAENRIKNNLKKQYALPNDSVVLMFLGRINKDKGIDELLSTIKDLLQKHPRLFFFLVGEVENDIDIDFIHIFAKLPRVFFLEKTNHPEYILNIADIMVIPSHREGFNQTVIEAAALEIPTIASKIYGLEDAILDGKTGLLHEVKNRQEMVDTYNQLINNFSLRKKLGRNAYERVVCDFNKEHTSKKFVNFFLKLQ